MKHVLIYGVAASALLLGSVAVSAQSGDPRVCRDDLKRLCKESRGEPDALRECVIRNRDNLTLPCRKMLGERFALATAGAKPSTTFSYGNDPEQSIDFYRGKSRTEAAPLIVFVHGGGWKRGDKRQAAAEKPAFFISEGYAFAAIDYRLVPGVTVERQAGDIADAIDTLRNRAALLGIDADRIALMGHSAGAHLSALVATDPRYLQASGVPMAAIKAVVLLDGAAYDVPAQMTEREPIMHATYIQAFGSDAARQRALSPTLQAAAPNAAAF